MPTTKIKLLTMSIISLLLFGCGSDKKDNYDGPVQGTVVEVPSAEIKTDSDIVIPESKPNTQPSEEALVEPTPTPSEPTPTEPMPTEQTLLYSDESRFTEIAPSVTDTAKFISSPALEYNFGSLIVNGKANWRSLGQPEQTQASDVRVAPFKGWIRYPQAGSASVNTNQKFPVIVLLHGQHSTQDPSYQGYDYLAKNLAEQGYVVLSIDANAINGTGGDSSSQSRAQLILGTLDKLVQLDQFGGAGVLSELRGKLDFDKIGIMGHSRGGQGIYLTLKFNTTRFGNDLPLLKNAIKEHPTNFADFPELINAVNTDSTTDEELLTLLYQKNISFAKTTNSVQPYNFKAAFALAPTDFETIKGINSVPVATLIPSCDGDVSNLQGVYNYDNNRFGLSYDSAPKYQILVRGANHNYFNTTWLKDDYRALELDGGYCNRQRWGNKRLSPQDQRRAGQFIMNSFFRYFVGNEQQFKSYWNATAQLPASSCPVGEDKCDERVIVTLQKNDSKIIQRFENISTLNMNLTGGFNQYRGFLADYGVTACSAYLGRKDESKLSKCSNPVVPFYDAKGNSYEGGLVSFTDQLHLTWENKNPVYKLNLNNLSTNGYDSLTFRVAIPESIGEEIIVELTDMNGNSAQVTASDFSDALYVIPRKKANGIPLTVLPEDIVFEGKTAESLNMVSIPLKAFKKIDTRYLSSLSFIFPKEYGSIAMNDIQLQKLRQ